MMQKLFDRMLQKSTWDYGENDLISVFLVTEVSWKVQLTERHNSYNTACFVLTETHKTMCMQLRLPYVCGIPFAAIRT